MKLKRRFKKALFAFFKDEIINSVDFDEKSERIKSERIKSEIVIEESRQMNNMPFEYVYEEALNKCKHDLFQKVMKHIQIDNQSVMETNLYRNNTRAIRVSLFIGNKN
jgi:septum formation topological specificity factor MinE